MATKSESKTQEKELPTVQVEEATKEETWVHPPCECGCGGIPKGKKARFLPGHDAKVHSRELAAERALEGPRYCECGCGTELKGRKSRFAPGHDARYYSKINAEAKAAAEAEKKAQEKVA